MRTRMSVLLLCAHVMLNSCTKETLSGSGAVPVRQLPPLPRNTDLPLTLIPNSGNICLNNFMQLRHDVQGIEFLINEITLDDGSVIRLNGPERVFSMKFKIYGSADVTPTQFARAYFRQEHIWTFNNNGYIFEYPTMRAYDTGIQACDANSNLPIVTFVYRSFLSYRFKAMITFGLDPAKPTSRHIVMLKP